MTTRDDTLALHALLDGELELTRELEWEARLRDDAALRDEWQGLERVRDVVRSQADYHRAPTALRQRLQAMSAAPTSQDQTLATRAARRSAWRLSVASAALVLLLAVAGWLFAPLAFDHQDERLTHEAVASHVRATWSQRLVDVASSDQHTVKPWLSAKLDYSPPVYAAPLPGMKFLGGRVDYLDARAVAVLVYQQRLHIIDTYVWPEGGVDTRPASASLRGFNAVHWRHDGMLHWAVSDLNRDELLAYAQALDPEPSVR